MFKGKNFEVGAQFLAKITFIVGLVSFIVYLIYNYAIILLLPIFGLILSFMVGHVLRFYGDMDYKKEVINKRNDVI